jgi:5-methylcytosine-specific restriction endonuclease McrA
MKIISKQDAKAAGLPKFFTGQPCKRGHVAARLVSNHHCIDCNREDDAAFYQAHKAKIETRKAIYRKTLKGIEVKRNDNSKRRAQKHSAPYLAHPLPSPADGRCPCCRVKMVQGHKRHGPSLDHIVSLEHGGHHVPINTWIICKSCNSSKHANPLLNLLDRLKVSKAARRKLLQIAQPAFFVWWGSQADLFN